MRNRKGRTGQFAGENVPADAVRLSSAVQAGGDLAIIAQEADPLHGWVHISINDHDITFLMTG